MPTTRCAGSHSATSAATASHRAATVAALTVVNGRASRVTLLPIATPMRRAPKSKPSTTWSVIGEAKERGRGAGAVARPSRSRMAGLSRQLQRVDAEQLQRRVVLLVGRRVEDDARLRRHG